MHVFDRGFANATDQWSVQQLFHHLKSMYNLLENTANQSQLVLALPPMTRPPNLHDSFRSAANVFNAAKIYFVAKSCSEARFVHWTSKKAFCWIDETIIGQRTNVDFLHYYDQECNNWTIQVYSTAKIDEEMNINLFVGSIIDDIPIQLPVYKISRPEATTISSNQACVWSQSVQSTDGLYEDRVNKIYEEELRTLIDRFPRKWQNKAET